jgi:calcineurin-like phosphoesterase family protein
MNRWFTSDLHFGHANIIKHCNRPFANVDEMNMAIIDNWNSVVKDGDKVIVLGDVALGKLDETLPLVTLLNGEKYLVPGNHDKCWTGHKKVRSSDIKRYEDVGFNIMPNDYTTRHGWWRVCHFPYTGDSQENDRYLEHRPVKGREKILVHGHVHEAWKINGNQINVGVDVWDFTPVHETVIRDIMGL